MKNISCKPFIVRFKQNYAVELCRITPDKGIAGIKHWRHGIRAAGVSLAGLNLPVPILSFNLCFTATCCLEKQLSCYLKLTLVKRRNTCPMLTSSTFSSVLITLSLTNNRGMNTEELVPIDRLARKVFTCTCCCTKQVWVILQFIWTVIATYGYFRGCRSMDLYPYIPHQEL